jgi:hypothetical protein
MNIKFKQLGVFLIVILAGATASASDADKWFGVHGFPLRWTALDRGDQRGDRFAPDAGERRRADFSGADSSGSSQSDNSSGNANDNAKRQGKMSPEDRRALRRQIDEAGHDIYRPKQR